VNFRNGLPEDTQYEDVEEPLPDVESYLSKVLFYGRSLVAAGDWPQAESVYKDAIAHMQESLGENHADVQVLYVELAELLAANDRPQEAEVFFILAIQAVENTKGKHHPNTYFRLEALAAFCATQGRYEDAMLVLRRAAEVVNNSPEGFSRPMLEGLFADIMSAQGKYEVAEKAARLSCDSWRKILGDCHPYVSRGLAHIGDLCARQGKCDEAAHNFLGAAKVNRDFRGDGHPETRRILECIFALLAVPGACSDAATLKAVAEEWLAKEEKAAASSQGVMLDSKTDECLLTPAGIFGRKVGFELIEDPDGKALLFQALNKRYQRLLGTADGRNLVRARMSKLISSMGYYWSEEMWEANKANHVWLEDVEARRNFKQALCITYCLLAENEAERWLSAMSVREDALNPSAS
jgi:tetratricopeptide (TPR) repeat protein